MRGPRVIAVLASAAVLTACSGGGSAARPSSLSSTVSAGSPFVVAAAAVGTRSRADVVALHAMGTSTTVDGAIPHDELPARGTVLRTQLQRQIVDASRLPPPAGSPAAHLVTALRSYAELAGRLATWDPSGGALPAQWFTQLRSADATWKQALTSLSAQSGHDLLAGLPQLVLPGA